MSISVLEIATTSGKHWNLRIPRFVNKFLSRIPIKISLPLLLTAPVVGVVLVLSGIAFVDGRSTANYLIEQNMAQIHDHIEERLEELLDLPYRLQQINANLISEDRRLSLGNLRNWERTLYEQIMAFGGISGILWGGSDGRAVGIKHRSNSAGYIFSIRDKGTGNNLHEFNLDHRAQSEKNPFDVYPYDPRIRPWYRAAVKIGHSTWTAPYGRDFQDGNMMSMALGYAQPFRDEKGDILGVLNAEMTLKDLSLYLEKLSVGRTGRSFLIDYQGRLLATSTGVPLVDINNRPMRALDSADKHIAAAAREIQKTFGSFKSLAARYQIRMLIHDDPYMLMTSRSEHKTGLTWVIATLVPESDFLAEIEAGRQRSIFIGAIAVLITLVIGIVFAALSLQPMLDLIAFVRRVGKGKLNQKLKLEYATEFVQLSKEINSMTAGLRDRMRLRNSMALAKEVQQNLLPTVTPVIDGLDMAGFSIYCDETGGDYYDFLDVVGRPETTAAIAVGDVVGHGVAAAMLMATARGILRTLCQTPGTLADLLTRLNALLVEDTGDDRFMTMLLMSVDAKEKKMRWASAGHDVPIVYDRKKERFIELKGNDISLGVTQDIYYREHQFADVQPGQVYLAATDGLWETFNQNGEMFGKKRVRSLLRRLADLAAAEISRNISEELTRFRGASSPDDDISFVVIKVL